MFRANKNIILLFGCLMLVACGSAPEKKSALGAQAVMHSERGTDAFARGDYARALNEYGLALRVDQAIEDAAGIAVARINLARVWREMSRSDQAHAQLDALFTPPVLAYPAASLAAAATLQARLYLEDGAVERAVYWLERGDAVCQKKCPVGGSLLLLHAQLSMREKHFQEAGRLIDEAVGLLDAHQQAVELANALRLSGEVAYALGDDASAASRFEQALELDQRSGLPAKIRLDLLRLAQTVGHAGHQTDAQNYADRARAVGKAMSDVSEAPVAAPLR